MAKGKAVGELGSWPHYIWSGTRETNAAVSLLLFLSVQLGLLPDKSDSIHR